MAIRDGRHEHISTSVCTCLYSSREGRGQVDELEMQEVYRWAKDRAAKRVTFQISGG